MSARIAGKKRRKGRVIAAMVVVAVVAAAVVYLVSSRNKPAQAGYTTVQAAKNTLVVTVSGSGNMVVGDQEAVDPGITGTVEGLKVSVGDKVKAGQLLYTVDNDDLDSQVTKALAGVRQAEESVSRAKLSILQAEQSLDKLESMPETSPQAPSDTDIAVAKQQVKSAKLGYSSAQANLSSANDGYYQARQNADKRTVKAPMTGVVTVMNLTNGYSVSGSSGSSSNSSSMGSASTGSSSSSSSGGNFVISDLSSMKASVAVNESDVSSVKIGQKATLTYDAIPDLSITGKVTKISLTGTNSSGVVTYNVEIQPDVQDARVKPNMSVSAEIVTQVVKDAVVVPNSAVKSDTSGSYVQTVSGGQLQRVDVTAGPSNDSYTQIVQGVSEGLAVVTNASSGSGADSQRNQMRGVGAFMGGPGR